MKKILKFFTFLALVLGLASCSAAPVGIEITSANNVRTIKAHQTLQLEAKVYPEGADKNVLWSTSDEKVATVNDNGLVTGVSKGNVNIIAKSKVNQEISQKFALIVEYGEAIVVPAESISISSPNNATSLKAGETLELTASVLPKEASQSVLWTSSDETVAKVTRGVVKGIKEGSVTITASPKNYENIKASINLTIEKNDDVTVTKDWAKMNYANHNEYIEVADNSPLKVKGVITQLIDNGETVDYFLQDGLSGYYIYKQSAASFKVELGKSYEVGGFKKNKPTKQITDVEYVQELNESVSYEVNELTGVNTADLTEMLEFQGALVSGKAVVSSLSVNTTKAYNFTAMVNGNSTTFRVDKTYSSADAVAEINDVLSPLVEGMEFEFEGLVINYGSGTQKPQIQLFDAERIMVSSISPVDYMKLVADKIQVVPSLGFSATSISLPTKLEGFEDVTIAWSSNKEEINAETGAVTHSSEKVTVTLTATLTYKGETYSKDYTVEVAALDNNVYETLVSVDFEDCYNENPEVSYSTSIKWGYDPAVCQIGSPKAPWLLDNALIGDSAQDIKDGTYSIRSYSGARIEIQQDGEYNVVEFDAAIYGSDTLGMQIKVEYSLDSGTTWVVDDELVTVSSRELETFRFTLPEGVKRVAIVVVLDSGKRVNIDNIKLMK